MPSKHPSTQISLGRARLTCRLVAAAFGIAAVGGPGSIASAATCGPDGGLVAVSPITFVGSLASVAADGAVATFSVEEVWGPETLPRTVQVFGDPGTWSDVAAGRYVVVASTVVDHVELPTGAPCPGFFVMSPGWEALRPPTAHPPFSPDTVSPDSETDLPVQLLLGGGALAVIGIVSAMVFRRRSSAV